MPCSYRQEDQSMAESAGLPIRESWERGARDNLGLAAPALLEACTEAFDSATWLAALEVVLEDD
jgi:hypothetical protein